MAASRTKLLTYPALRNGYDSEICRLDGDRPDFEDGLLEAHGFVDLIRRTTEMPYVFHSHDRFHRWREGAKILVKNRGVLNSLTEPFLARFHLSPQINALVQIEGMYRLPRNPLNPRDPWLPNESYGTHGKACAEIFNLVVQMVRERASAPGFNKPVIARRAAALADCASASALVKSVCTTTRHVLTNRVDLLYRESVRGAITPGKVKKDLGAFLNNWRKHQVFKVLKGYLWKLQYGSISGYYIHLIVMMDAGRMDLSAQPVRAFGKVWEAVTSGDGEIRTISQRVPIFSGGHGLWQDKRKERDTLLAGIYYLLQKDQYFRVRSGLSPRVFGKSELT